jgi:hypothetical protein
MNNPQRIRAPNGRISALGKNGKASKLIDAAIWIFIVTGFSISTSVLYVFGLSIGFNFQFQSYFGIRDYLEVTPYWLGPALSGGFLLFFMFCIIKYLKDRGEFRLKREPGEKLRSWVTHLISPVLFISFAVLVLAYIISVPVRAFAGLRVIGIPFGIYWCLNDKISEGALGSLVEKIRRRPFLWQCVTLVLTVSLFAVFLGAMWEPEAFWNRPISIIYLAGSNSEVRGRMLFSLNQYLMAMREDGTFVTIPVAKIDRIETPRAQIIGRESAPTPTPIQTTTPTPLPMPNAILSSPAKNSPPVSATPSLRLGLVPKQTQTPSTAPPHP